MFTRKMSFMAPFLALMLSVCTSTARPQAEKGVNPSPKKVERDSKVYVAPMEDHFDTYLIAGIMKKQVPVVIVTDKSKADYEISAVSESDKAGWAKMLFLGSEASREQASIKVVYLKTGEIVYGYNVHKGNSYRGRQSAAEACAKHLKENIEGK